MSEQKLNIEYERQGDYVEVLVRGHEDDVRAALARLLGDHTPDAGKMVEAWRKYDGDHEAVEPEPKRKVLGWIIADQRNRMFFCDGLEHTAHTIAERVAQWDKRWPGLAPHRALRVWSDGQAEAVEQRVEGAPDLFVNQYDDGDLGNYSATVEEAARCSVRGWQCIIRYVPAEVIEPEEGGA